MAKMCEKCEKVPLLSVSTCVSKFSQNEDHISLKPNFFMSQILLILIEPMFPVIVKQKCKSMLNPPRSQ